VSPSFSPEQIAEVQQATDIVDLISAYVPLKRKGKDYLALCPFHEEKTPSFSVSPSKQIFKCFGCGVGGDVIGFLMKHERMAFVEAVQFLAERAGIRLRYEGAEAPEAARAKGRLYDACRWAADEYHRQLVAAPAGKAALDYLTGRGLTRETIDGFRLGFAPDAWEHLVGHGPAKGFNVAVLERAGLAMRRQDGRGCYDRFRNRVIFPITDVRGRPIAFGGRGLGDETPKYLNSPDTPLFNKSRLLYGLDVAKDAIVRERRACIVEGYMDLLMAHQCGIEWTVATLGTALTESHLHLLRRYAEVAVLVFDGDAAGRAATDRGLELFLRQELDVQVCVLPAGQDPCDFLLARGTEAFTAALGGAQNAFEFKLSDIEARYDLERDVEKHRAIDEALGLLAKLPARTRGTWSVRRDLMLAGLARRMHVGEDGLRSRLRQLTGRSRSRQTPPASLGPRDRFERELVEILVCRSDLAREVRAILPPAEMRDGTLGRIAGRIGEAATDEKPLGPIRGAPRLHARAPGQPGDPPAPHATARPTRASNQ